MKPENSEKEHQLLTRSLINKIGPVNMDMVIGDAPYGSKHMLKLGGKRVEDNEALALKREAELLEQMKLWKVFLETLRYQAQETMFLKSQKSEDVFISGKFLLHAISTLEHIVWAAKNPLLLAEQMEISTPKHKKGADSIKKRVINKDK